MKMILKNKLWYYREHYIRRDSDDSFAFFIGSKTYRFDGLEEALTELNRQIEN